MFSWTHLSIAFFRLQDKKINRADLIDTIQQIRSHLLSRVDSKVITNDRCEQHNHDTIVDVQFITVEKLSSNARKRSENQVSLLIYL